MKRSSQNTPSQDTVEAVSPELTYSEAMAELERIVSEIQNSQSDVDKLCDLTRRGIELIKFCREMLSGTDRELAALLESLEQ